MSIADGIIALSGATVVIAAGVWIVRMLMVFIKMDRKREAYRAVFANQLDRDDDRCSRLASSAEERDVDASSTLLFQRAEQPTNF